MNIYLIEDKEKLGDSVRRLKPFGNVIPLTSGEKDINKYKQLFEDSEEKVLGVNTGIIEWKLPNIALKQMKNLKGICSKSTWANYIDLEYCKKHNISVSNIPGYNSQSVAEYAIWMMFSLAKKLPLQVGSKFKAVLNEKTLETEIDGKVMGILGLGNIGKKTAKMGKGLGMKVVYWSKNTRDKNYDYKKIDELLKTSDFVFNCVQTLDDTKGFLDKKRLNLLKSDAYVISVIGGMGWGPQDDNYLIDMVNRGMLAGYAVENEDEPNYKRSKINKDANIFTPANYAFYTKEAQKRGKKMWIESIIACAKGKPINLVR